PRAGIDFFPLGVDFEEKMYAVGRIPGGFKKREGRPSDKAILVSRLIDRPIRPLFPKGFFNDVAIVATAMSVDTNIPPEVYGMLGSSIALSISDIPFAEPTGAVVVGYVDGEYIINPDAEQREMSKLSLSLAGTKDAIMMVEAGANEITEEEMLNAILFGHEEIKKIVAFIETIQADCGKEKSAEIDYYSVPEEIKLAINEYASAKMDDCLSAYDRSERQAKENALDKEVFAHFAEIFEGKTREIGDAMYAMKKEKVRRKITENGVRPDGRTLTEIRPIWCEVGVIPRAHGSAVFTRGQTQALSVVTLAGPGMKQDLDGVDPQTEKRYMHKYIFPGFSVGEVKPMRGPGRREVGHGCLAERANIPALPSQEDFGYTIRVTSDILESNGSTSMASTCGSSMALMNAGVPVKCMIGGVAMGLIKEDDKVAVLTDIQGIEDFLGDMDFKVTGNENAITAIQM
ncbi:polyribonucleotide nucleotidyltransferase, partial [Candidatus Nomurabacteria bacterium]|nr:polyribonucleotide nucleotidyltransferase [Candidatus Nomurabacteria bacterium]